MLSNITSLERIFIDDIDKMGAIVGNLTKLSTIRNLDFGKGRTDLTRPFCWLLSALITDMYSVLCKLLDIFSFLQNDCNKLAFEASN